MSANDININMKVVRDTVLSAIEKDVPEEAKGEVRIIVTAGLSLLHNLLLDINRIADAVQPTIVHKLTTDEE